MLRALVPLFAVFIASQGACKEDGRSNAYEDQSERLVAYRHEAVPKRDALTTKQPKWLETPPACPSAWMPKRYIDLGFPLDTCSGDGFEACLAECEKREAGACYGIALILQEDDEGPKAAASVATALFARSCKLGYASGCTNWGAAIKRDGDTSPEQTRCLRQTFENACIAGQDPWGCTMYGYAVADEGLDQGTIDKLVQWSKTSCSEEDDPACAAMRKLISDATAALARFPDAGPTAP